MPVGFLQRGQGLHRRAHARNGRHGLRARTDVPLLAAAVKRRRQAGAAGNIQCAGSLGAVDLMRADRHQVNAPAGRVQRQPAVGLHSVHMQQRGGLDGGNGPGGGINWQNRSHLVVDRHHADQNGLRRYRLPDLALPDAASMVRLQINHLKALLFQGLHGIQHRGMLHSRGHNTLAAPGSAVRRPQQGDIVCLCPAGSKVDFRGPAAQ